MEIGKIIDAPIAFDVVLSESSIAESRCHCIGAKNNHIEASWWSVVDPFGSKQPYRMQRRQISLLGMY